MNFLNILLNTTPNKTHKKSKALEKKESVLSFKDILNKNLKNIDVDINKLVKDIVKAYKLKNLSSNSGNIDKTLLKKEIEKNGIKTLVLNKKQELSKELQSKKISFELKSLKDKKDIEEFIDNIEFLQKNIAFKKKNIDIDINKLVKDIVKAYKLKNLSSNSGNIDKTLLKKEIEKNGIKTLVLNKKQELSKELQSKKISFELKSLKDKKDNVNEFVDNRELLQKDIAFKKKNIDKMPKNTTKVHKSKKPSLNDKEIDKIFLKKGPKKSSIETLVSNKKHELSKELQSKKISDESKSLEDKNSMPNKQSSDNKTIKKQFFASNNQEIFKQNSNLNKIKTNIINKQHILTDLKKELKREEKKNEINNKNMVLPKTNIYQNNTEKKYAQLSLNDIDKQNKPVNSNTNLNSKDTIQNLALNNTPSSNQFSNGDYKDSSNHQENSNSNNSQLSQANDPNFNSAMKQKNSFMFKVNDIIINATLKNHFLTLSLQSNGSILLTNGLENEIKSILNSSGFKNFNLTIKDREKKVYIDSSKNSVQKREKSNIYVLA